MKPKRILLTWLFLGVALFMACRDESLYPLPYNNRDVGAYLRIYRISSNVIDRDDIVAGGSNSFYEMVLEAVDEENGRLLESVEFFISHQAGGVLTPEVPLATVDASAFTPVPEPTYSEYRRATVRFNYDDIVAALGSASCGVPSWPSGFSCGSFSNPPALGTSFILRWRQNLSNGKSFTTINQQGTNPDESNVTPNIAGGQFYSSPYIVAFTVRRVTNTGDSNAYTGSYNLTQVGIWSPVHSGALHTTPQLPSYLRQPASILFPNQTVNLDIPSGGPSNHREFQVSFKAPLATTPQDITMRISLENGTVFVPLQNTGVDCTSEREIYFVTPTTGSFAGTGSVSVPGIPTGSTPNRGTYSMTVDGLTAGQTFTIGVDVDADEYGRRNGYCTWTLRTRLLLTKN